MTPDELAERVPKLYHVAKPGMSKSIRANGLLSTSKLLDLFEIPEAERDKIMYKRRPENVAIEHSIYGTALINDQKPISEVKLANCLDDDLTPSEWLALLNRRVFLWPNEARLEKFLACYPGSEVIVLDTLSLAQCCSESVELCAFNSGSTYYLPPRRGLASFTPLLEMSYQEWSKKRGKRDKIAEVVVVGSVLDIDRHILDIRHSQAS